MWLLSPTAGYGGNGVTVPCFQAGIRCENYELTYFTMQVDRIRPGILHGRYVQDNVRPACQPCNFELGIELREKIRRGEILIMSSLDSDKSNIVLFKEGRHWVASAQQGGRIIAEARGTNRLHVMADLSVSLLEEVIIRTATAQEQTS
jgi:hypothetical protein